VIDAVGVRLGVRRLGIGGLGAEGDGEKKQRERCAKEARHVQAPTVAKGWRCFEGLLK
jgi:hypothetical protein